MSPTAKKRPFKSEKSFMRPKKRSNLGRGSLKAKKECSPESIRKRHLAPEEVKWKQVPIPDQLHDAEGFFGLEEVENVEIIRNAHSGDLEYRAVRQKANSGRENGKTYNVDPFVDLNRHVDVATIERDEEWEGFGEAETEHATMERPEPKVVSVTPKPRKKNVQKKKDSKCTASSTGQPASQIGNAFAGLDAEVLETEVDVSAWNLLGLSPETLLSLSKLGFSRPTPIQSAAVPDICGGYDVIGKASTGSGKTLAFGIPILEHYLQLEERKSPALKLSSGFARPEPCALVLSPTRELAHQLAKHLEALFSNAPSGGLSIAIITGGLSLQKQRRLLSTADVVVATPGRLWEVMSEGAGSSTWLRKTRFLVIDEADRLLSEGHFAEFEEILNVLDREDEDAVIDSPAADVSNEQIRPQRQTLVFSATFHKGLQQKLSGKATHGAGDLMDKQQSLSYLLQRLHFKQGKPKFIDVNPVSQMAEGLREGLIECAALEKDLYLYALIMYCIGKRTLIFANSISAVRRLTAFLQELTVGAQALHSQMPQKARLRSVERFAAASSRYSVLVATDVAARGLDIPHVQLVVHYHLPRTADMYVHRSGRTARAEESGSSILLCAADEVVGVRRLVAKVHASAAFKGGRIKHYIRSVDLDRRVVARLKPRVTLSKRITESMLAKEKKGHEDGWLRTAADELGVDYDSEDFEAANGTRKGRGTGKLRAAREARSMSKGDVAALRTELKSLLRERINVGVSEKYLTAGEIDIDSLLEKDDTTHFLGKLDGVDLDND